jgi:hypothetical protein
MILLFFVRGEGWDSSKTERTEAGLTLYKKSRERKPFRAKTGLLPASGFDPEWIVSTQPVQTAKHLSHDISNHRLGLIVTPLISH